jgi:hypothetical protein
MEKTKYGAKFDAEEKAEMKERLDERFETGDSLFPFGKDVEVTLLCFPYLKDGVYASTKGGRYKYIFDVGGVPEIEFVKENMHHDIVGKYKVFEKFVIRVVSPNEYELKDGVGNVPVPEKPEVKSVPDQPQTEQEMWFEKEKRELRHRAIATAGNILKDRTDMNAENVIMDAEKYFDVIINGFPLERQETAKTKSEEAKCAKLALIDEIIAIWGDIDDRELEGIENDIDGQFTFAQIDDAFKPMDNRESELRIALEDLSLEAVELIFGMYSK